MSESAPCFFQVGQLPLTMGCSGQCDCKSNSGMAIAHWRGEQNCGTKPRCSPRCCVPACRSPCCGAQYCYSPCKCGQHCWVPPSQSPFRSGAQSFGSPCNFGQAFCPPCHWVPSSYSSSCNGSLPFCAPCRGGQPPWGCAPYLCRPCCRAGQSYFPTCGPVQSTLYPYCHAGSPCILLCMPVHSCQTAEKSTSCNLEESADCCPEKATAPSPEPTACKLKTSSCTSQQSPGSFAVESPSLTPAQSKVEEETLEAKGGWKLASPAAKTAPTP